MVKDMVLFPVSILTLNNAKGKRKILCAMNNEIPNLLVFGNSEDVVKEKYVKRLKELANHGIRFEMNYQKDDILWN